MNAIVDAVTETAAAVTADAMLENIGCLAVSGQRRAVLQNISSSEIVCCVATSEVQITIKE